MIKYKYSKYGSLPGDIPSGRKIRMLESKEPFNIWGWQSVTVNQIKSYRNDHYKRANRRFRKGNKPMVVSAQSIRYRYGD